MPGRAPGRVRPKPRRPYEDEESIAAKGQYVRGKGLGGTIIWTIGQGHLSGAPAGSRDPLLKAVHQAFLAP